MPEDINTREIRSSNFKVIAAVLLLLAITGFDLCRIYKKEVALQLSIAAVKLEMIRGILKPVDLSDAYPPNTAFTRPDPLYRWTTVPRGYQVFRHIPLNIDGLIYLWGSESANHYHEVFPENCTGIAVNREIESLYICHTTFFTASNGTPVYSVVFNYNHGDPESNDVCYGSDLLNLTPNPKRTNSVPSNHNSKVAWIGGSFQEDKNEPMRFILTAVTNPHPYRLVTSIDLCSRKSRATPVIFAITAGKAGLMK